MIAIIDGCGANIASVQFACARLGKKSVLTTDPAVIKAASHVILPGVGTAALAMSRLKSLHLTDIIPTLTQPVLGICLGMQLLYEASREGDVPCLGLLQGKVELLPDADGLIVPHMGWNQLQMQPHSSPITAGVETNSYVYFVHSYAAPVSDYTVATTDYGRIFSAIVNKDNFYGMQFHPERSGAVGATLLKNFLESE